MATKAQQLQRWGSWSTWRLPTGVDGRTEDKVIALQATQDAVARQLHAIESRRGDHDARSRMEAERVRVRVELVSMRADTVVVGAAPPSGREFDFPADAGDESAYDALEKAYNLAFAVSSPERLKRTASEDGLSLPDCRDESQRAIEKEVRAALQRVVERKTRLLTVAELASTTEAIEVWKRDALLQRQDAVEKLRRSITHVDQHEGGKLVDTWRRYVLFGRDSVVERARSVAVTRAKRHKVLQQMAEACRSRVLGRSKTRNHADNGFARAAAPLKVQIPRLTRESVQAHARVSPSEDGGDGIPMESKAVGDFLAAELGVFASFLTHGRQQSLESHQTAAVTSANLWRDFQRALSDLESESGRLSTLQTGPVAHDLHDSKLPALNPFQRLGDNFDTSWKSSLKSVEYVDCQTGSVRGDVGSSPLRESDMSRNLTSLHNRGLNGIALYRGDGIQPEIASFILQIERMRSADTIHLLVTRSSRLREWREALSSAKVLVISRTREDQEHARTCARNGKSRGSPRVLIVDFETLAHELDSFSTYSLHLCLFDLDVDLTRHPHDSSAAVWLSLLSLRCRQRVMILPASTGVDVRTLALFTYPAAFCSRRKIMAWNCATLNKRHIVSIIDAISACVVSADAGKSILVEWSASIEKATLIKTLRETKTLQTLVKQVAAVPTTEIGADTRTSPFHQYANGVLARFSRKAIPRLGNSLASAEDVLRQSTQVKELPLKRRLHLRTHRSRKRVSRCGKCAGCLAEDCMTCGHCQDMKKYGGPGLRKQSCKKRKCIQPKTWGLTRKKPRRGDSMAGTESRDVSEDEFSDSESEAGSTENGGDSALSSEESELEQSITRAPQTAIEYGSDSGYDSSHFSDETVDTPSCDIHDMAEDAELYGEQYESQSRAGRSRIMRCGKCRGCTSGDCMKCIHCRDMKKYGGLGLRKQSCKYRKCIAPKVVLLNQTREKHDEDRDSAETGSSYGGDDDTTNSKRSMDVDTSDLLLSTARLDSLHMLQECELVVRKFLFFTCDVCLHAFISQRQLDRHLDCTHTALGEHDEWEEVAEQVLTHPAHQFGCLITSRRSINPSWLAPPVRAYAKLEGHGFEYFFLKPYAVLGRMTPRWIKFYESRGIASPKGLGGGAIDCHLGDDAMIANTHALIQWDAARGYFTIECLSMRSSLSVNGRDVHFSSRPLALRSHDLIQIGASTAYFLLPTTSGAASSSQVTTARQIPRAEMRAWLEAAVAKRRAQRAEDEAIQTKIRELLTDGK